MLYKLRKIELSGKFFHAINALYKTSKSSVQINNVASEWFDVTNWVRQGDSLTYIIAPNGDLVCLGGE